MLKTVVHNDDVWSESALSDRRGETSVWTDNNGNLLQRTRHHVRFVSGLASTYQKPVPVGNDHETSAFFKVPATDDRGASPVFKQQPSNRYCQRRLTGSPDG